MRRATEHLAGRENSQYDERIARHIYDVHQIATLHYGQSRSPLPHDLFAAVLAGDAERYGNRLDGFREDPVGTLRRTLTQVSRRPELREHYERFVAELVYGARRPVFDEAFTTFQIAASALLAGATQ